MEEKLSDNITSSKFKVGDRVIYNRFGKGTVICLDGGPNVRFDLWDPTLHNLDGLCENNHGWHCNDIQLKLAEIKVTDTRLARKMYPNAILLADGMLLIEVD